MSRDEAIAAPLPTNKAEHRCLKPPNPQRHHTQHTRSHSELVVLSLHNPQSHTGWVVQQVQQVQQVPGAACQPSATNPAHHITCTRAPVHATTNLDRCTVGGLESGRTQAGRRTAANEAC